MKPRNAIIVLIFSNILLLSALVVQTWRVQKMKEATMRDAVLMLEASQQLQIYRLMTTLCCGTPTPYSPEPFEDSPKEAEPDKEKM